MGPYLRVRVRVLNDLHGHRINNTVVLVVQLGLELGLGFIIRVRVTFRVRVYN